MFQVTTDLTANGFIDQKTLDSSITQLLVRGDTWELLTNEFCTPEDNIFKCTGISKWTRAINEGWWTLEQIEGYYEVITEEPSISTTNLFKKRTNK